MIYDPLLIPARKLPWIKVITVFAGITVGLAGAIYLWTSKRNSFNNQIELAEKEMSIAQVRKEHADKITAERKECEKIPIKTDKSGCFKRHS